MRYSWLAVLVVLFAVLFGARPMSGSQPTPAKIRIGTYDNRAVALAYSRTADWAAHLKQLSEAHTRAKASGSARAIENAAAALDRRQWTAHRQVFGHASVSEYLSAHADALAQAAKESDVSMIVWNPDYIDTNTFEVVDVTEAVVAIFHPDDKTLQTIAELRKHEPVMIGDDFRD